MLYSIVITIIQYHDGGAMMIASVGQWKQVRCGAVKRNQIAGMWRAGSGPKKHFALLLPVMWASLCLMNMILGYTFLLIQSCIQKAAPLTADFELQ